MFNYHGLLKWLPRQVSQHVSLKASHVQGKVELTNLSLLCEFSQPLGLLLDTYFGRRSITVVKPRTDKLCWMLRNIKTRVTSTCSAVSMQVTCRCCSNKKSFQAFSATRRTTGKKLESYLLSSVLCFCFDGVSWRLLAAEL